VIHCWDVATGKLRAFWPAHKDAVNTLALSPNGKALLSASRDKTVRLWHVPSGKQRAELPPLGEINALAFCPDGKTFATAGADLRLWDARTARPLRSLRGHRGEVTGVCFVRDGSTLISAGRDESIRFWNVTTGKLLRRLPCTNCGTGVIALSPDQKLLAAGLIGIQLLDPRTGKECRALRPYRLVTDANLCRSVAFSPDGRLLTAAFDSRVRVWDRKTYREIPRSCWVDHPASPAYGVDGSLLLWSHDDGAMHLWKPRTAKTLFTLRPDGHLVSSRVVRTTGGRDLVLTVVGSGRFDITASLWDAATGRLLCSRSVDERRTYLLSQVVSPDGKTFAVVNPELKKGELSLWVQTVGSSAPPRIFRVVNDPGYRLDDGAPGEVLTFSADGSLLAVTAPGGGVQVWDVRTGKRRPGFPRDAVPPVYNARFSPDGRWLFTFSATKDHKEGLIRCGVDIWDLGTGRLVSPQEQTPVPGSLEFTADGALLVSREDRTILVREVATWEPVLRLRTGGLWIDSLSVHPRGTEVAAGVADGTVLVWDLAPAGWKPPPGRATAEQLRQWWDALAGADARKAHAAVWSLSSVPRQAVPFLKERLRPIAPVPAERIRHFIADLDHDDFTRRQQASRALASIDRQAETLLRAAHKTTTSPEVRSRTAQLLKAIDRWVVTDPEHRRRLRAIWVLQRLGTPEARALLQKLAEGAAAARQTQAARGALLLLNKTTSRSSTP
jgi:WD40 repeat protein